MKRIAPMLALVACFASASADGDSDRDESRERDDEVRVYTNADLKPVPRSGRSPDRAADAERGTRDTWIAPLTYDSYTDRQGRDAEWWKRRVRTADAAIDAAEQELERATEAYARCRGALRRFDRVFVCDAPATRAAAAAVEAAQATLAARRQERTALDDEARRAGALPGWLRDAHSATNGNSQP